MNTCDHECVTPRRSHHGGVDVRTMRTWLPHTLICFYILTISTVIVIMMSCRQASPRVPPQQHIGGGPVDTIKLPPMAQPRTTLITYVYASNDAEYETNLRFFLTHGVADHPCCRYAVILNHEPTQAPPANLPPLPFGSKYIEHTNECYDW